MKTSTQDDVAPRRRFLSMGLGMGAAGAATLAMPDQAVAGPGPRGTAVFTPRHFGAVGDGTTDDHQALQDTIDAASGHQFANPHHRVVLDLWGLTYRFNSPLTVPDQLTIQDGCLHASTGNGAIAIQALPSQASYAELTCINVKFRKLQYSDVVGLQVTDGLRCYFERCEFENFRNGSNWSKALVLEGVQVATFVGCVWSDNDVHVHFQQSSGGTPSTDCRFIGCSMVEARQRGITSDCPSSGVAAASATFHCCSIEVCTGAGSMVQLVDVRDFRFDACRFEEGHPDWPIVSLAEVNETSRPRFLNCTFAGSGTTGAEACVALDAGVSSPLFMGNVFPSSGRVALSAGGNYSAWGNENLADT